MSEEKKEFVSTTCCACGILFGIPPNVEEAWRREEHTFCCPNGHPLVWKKSQSESEEQKELKSLRSKVTDLQSKLDTALKDAADQKKRADDLANELEIWRPSTKEPETPVGQ